MRIGDVSYLATLYHHIYIGFGAVSYLVALSPVVKDVEQCRICLHAINR